MKYQITINTDIDQTENDGGQMTLAAHAILKSMLEKSSVRTLSMEFSQENQQRIAEEIGYRKAILEFISYFTLPQESN